MKIYTRYVDDGSTSLRGGRRVPKHHQRIEAYGTVDELISWIGLVRCYVDDERNSGFLLYIQDQLMAAAATLACDNEGNQKGKVIPEDDCIEKTEKEIDRLGEELPPLNSFILPGGNIPASYCHIARCVCRRAEREVLKLAENENVPGIVVKFLNRLSDYLFMFSRYLCHIYGNEENIWDWHDRV